MRVVFPHLFSCAFGKTAYGLKCLLADVVLYLAGILAGDILGYAQPDKKLGKLPVTGIHAFGNFKPGLGQGDEPVAAHGDVAVFPQPLGGVAHAGLGDPHMLGNVYRADKPLLLLQYEHCLQIIFGRFLYLHPINTFFFTVCFYKITIL